GSDGWPAFWRRRLRTEAAGSPAGERGCERRMCPVEAYVNGQRIRHTPAQAIGKGGEADVYALPASRVLKVFKAPAHPDFQGLPDEQAAARQRLEMHQEKLPALLALARALPERVVAPQELATDRAGR